jgi:hypothetical protein
MTQRYEVVGVQPVLEHEPGEVFTAEIEPDLERFLIEIGGLRKVTESAKKPSQWSSSKKTS